MSLSKRLASLAGFNRIDPVFRGKFLRWFRLLGVVPAGAAAVLSAVALYFWATLPDLDELERIAPSLITKVYDRDSVLIREYYTERRIWTPLAEVPERQVEAVLAIEDQDFFHHGGVDLMAIPAAALPALQGRRVRGASTLTQQLTKILFLTSERTLGRKVREIFLAIKIERTYTKREILEFYLNQVYLGAGAYGFQAAAERYFSKALDSLSLSEQALLAGLLQRPESLRPDRRPDQAVERRNLVLRAMAQSRVIGREEMRAAQAEPLLLRMKAVQATAGLEAPYFMETVRRGLERRWGRGFLDSAGARIYTTLDRRAQDLVDSAVEQGLAFVQDRLDRRTAYELQVARRLKVSERELMRDFPLHWARFDSLFLRGDSAEAARRFPEHLRWHKAQAAVVVLENGTGEVTALCGGRDWRESEFNRAVQAIRSPGSAFKPIVYAAAVDKGWTPATRVDDSPIAMPDPDDSTKIWRPHNLEYDWEGPMSMRRALYRSRNIPAILVGMQTGLDTVVAYARRFGLGQPMRPVPSLPIGGVDATPLEMTAAFSVFPGGGRWIEPRLVRRVVDRHGASMALGEPMEREVMSAPGAWILCGMLQDVNIRGTAADVWASGFQHPSGGKTGTSNDYRDAWYIGFTKRYTVGVWVGTDDHASMGSGHSGADDALPIWLDIMRGLHKGKKPEPFPRPKGVGDVTVCQRTGRIPQAFCDSLAYDYRVAAVGKTIPPCTPEIHDAAVARAERLAEEKARKAG
ncbi:MAG TPA: PBP1A family penicillin-binding protein, partial [Fibrobacteria bacterium]|nr:PBP1A family penicillin-binding protein [Fibrobacteria bacterium]